VSRFLSLYYLRDGVFPPEVSSYIYSDTRRSVYAVKKCYKCFTRSEDGKFKWMVTKNNQLQHEAYICKRCLAEEVLTT
jgi:superfamily II helicase